VHDQGYKVVLTGEGSDESQAGYWWFKSHAMMRCLDVGGFRPSTLFSLVFRKANAWHVPWAELRRIDRIWGGPHSQSEMYNFIAGSRHRFYDPGFRAGLAGEHVYEDLAAPFDLDRMRRWHPLNRSLYIGLKTLLPGMLLSHKGDRVAMANSVEARYPFLDHDVLALCARVNPRWKLRGLFGDKHLLRQAALRRLPSRIALRRKAMFMAPMAESFLAAAPDYVRQLLSAESLRRTGYFDVAAVRREFTRYAGPRPPRLRHFVEMGLVSVVATQLWHHLHLGGGLCDLPAAGPAPRIERPAGIRGPAGESAVVAAPVAAGSR
jgi:asparagine synthase (glutamine-hydrolysing)